MLKEKLFSDAMLGNGGGGSNVEVVSLNVTHNGTYDGSESSQAFSPVYVNVQPEYPVANPVIIGNTSPLSNETKVTVTWISAEWDSVSSKDYLGKAVSTIRENQTRTFTIPIYPEGEAIVKIEFATFTSIDGDIEVFDEGEHLYRITGSCHFGAEGVPI